MAGLKSMTGLNSCVVCPLITFFLRQNPHPNLSKTINSKNSAPKENKIQKVWWFQTTLKLLTPGWSAQSHLDLLKPLNIWQRSVATALIFMLLLLLLFLLWGEQESVYQSKLVTERECHLSYFFILPPRAQTPKPSQANLRILAMENKNSWIKYSWQNVTLPPLWCQTRSMSKYGRQLNFNWIRETFNIRS